MRVDVTKLLLSQAGMLELAILGLANYIEFVGQFRSIEHLFQYFTALGYVRMVRILAHRRVTLHAGYEALTQPFIDDQEMPTAREENLPPVN